MTAWKRGLSALRPSGTLKKLGRRGLGGERTLAAFAEDLGGLPALPRQLTGSVTATQRASGTLL